MLDEKGKDFEVDHEIFKKLGYVLLNLGHEIGTY